MNRENPFEEPTPNKPKREDKYPIKGDGFMMGEKPYFSKNPGSVQIDFREGASSEEALKEIEQLRQEYHEKEAKMTAEEKTKRAEKWAQEEKDFIPGWFRDGIKRGGKYSETLKIKQDGSLDEDIRVDGFPPFIVRAGNLKNLQDLYQLLQKISQEQADLDITLKIDPNREWVKYCVSNKIAK